MRKFLIFHPFLFAIFPILSLFAYNIEEVPAADLWLPISVALAGTLILLLSLRLITKSGNKIAIIATSFLILFFSYGHVRDAIFSPAAKTSFGANIFLASLWAVLFVVGTFFIIRSHRDFATLTKFLNITAVVLVTISLINVGIYEVRMGNLKHGEMNVASSSPELSSTGYSPDIYYITLDMYAREDTLKELFDYDNSEFTNHLTSRGFYVATKSFSNYSTTYLSLASSLSMDYPKQEDKDMPTLLEMIGNSKVSQFLKSRGYRYIFVGGGMEPKGIKSYAEVYSYRGVFGMGIGDFAQGLSDTTALSPFARFFGGLYGANSILYAFDALAEIPDIKEPTFVYAHIMSPHPPWFFDSDGPREFKMFGPREGEMVSEGYLGNLIFISKKVETLIDEILSESSTPPIIILQGDHGLWWVEESYQHYEILNAYHLPEGGNRFLYETISPVNSFRVIFNLYFDTDYDLLEDERPALKN
ncbi:MAG: sulfatase-like hydrolase/transferase [bacterium]